MILKIIPNHFESNPFLNNFERMIKLPENINALFLFNDSYELHNTCKKGNGNSIVRPYNRYNKLIKKPQSAGIPVTKNGKGYTINNKHEAIESIDNAFDEIKVLLNEYKYDKIYYSVDKNGNYNTGMYYVDKYIKEYISKQILLLQFATKYNFKLQLDMKYPDMKFPDMKLPDMKLQQDMLQQNMKLLQNMKLQQNMKLEVNDIVKYGLNLYTIFDINGDRITLQDFSKKKFEFCNIKDVTLYSKYNPYLKNDNIQQKKCKAVGCIENHAQHYCRNCGNKDSTHRKRDCPYKNIPNNGLLVPNIPNNGHLVPNMPPPLRRVGRNMYMCDQMVEKCKAVGCVRAHPFHFCKCCFNKDSTHRAIDCPYKNKQNLNRKPPQNMINIKNTAMYIFLNENSKIYVLVGVRSFNFLAGKITTQGGAIEYNETSLDAVIRETKEEVGLDIGNKTIRYFDTYRNNTIIYYLIYTHEPYIKGRTNSFAEIYEDERIKNMVPLKNNRVLRTTNNKITGLAWVDINEIIKYNEINNYNYNVQNLLLRFKSEIFN